MEKEPIKVRHFFIGLSRLSTNWIATTLCNIFNLVFIALLVLAFWHPLYAVVIFVLLFLITLMGMPVRIPRTFKGFCKGMWNWFVLLMWTPTDDKFRE